MGICDHCGAELHWQGPALLTVMVLQRTPLEGHIQKLVELESVSVAIATEWVHHRNRDCPRRVAFCPKCNGELRTWRAQQCPHCFHVWHRQQL